MTIYVLKKREPDYGLSEDTPQWQNVGYTTDRKVLREWLDGFNKYRGYDELAEIVDLPP